MPSKVIIEIKQALYGIKGQTADVTEAAQNSLTGDDLTVSVKKLGIEDPAPGEMKFFAVKAMVTIDDNEPYAFHYIAKDYETIDFIP